MAQSKNNNVQSVGQTFPPLIIKREPYTDNYNRRHYSFGKKGFHVIVERNKLWFVTSKGKRAELTSELAAAFVDYKPTTKTIIYPKDTKTNFGISMLDKNRIQITKNNYSNTGAITLLIPTTYKDQVADEWYQLTHNSNPKLTILQLANQENKLLFPAVTVETFTNIFSKTR